MATSIRTKTVASSPTCPRCFEEVQERPTEHVCPDCGLVIDADPIDYGPDWRSFESDETNPERASPGNRNHADRGLGSTVRWRDWDVDTERREKINRHTQNGRSTDYNRAYATEEIHRMTDRLDLPEFVGERGKYLFRQYHENGCEGQNLDSIAAACLYAACREHGMGRAPDELATVARCEARPIRRKLWDVAHELGLEVPPPDVRQRIRVVGNRLPDGSDAVQQAVSAFEKLDGTEVASGSPSTLAAALLYESGPWTQEEVAEAAHITPGGLRTRRDRLADS